MLEIDHNSAVPLRAQVEQLLREMIRKPEYQNGALLPDEVALAAQLGVSRGTVRSGISKLVFEGALDRKAGVGTRVSHRYLESGITAWRSFAREMAAKGITVQTFRLDYRMVGASEQAAASLQVASKTQVWRLERVRGWNNTPILLSTSWFHPRLGLKGTEDFTRPLYQVIEAATAVRPDHAREEFLAIQGTAAHCELLKVPRGAPLLLRQHTVFDPGNRPFEFAEVRYVSSRFTLTLDLHQGKGKQQK